MPNQWYLLKNKVESGPFDALEILRKMNEGEIHPYHSLRREDDPQWYMAAKVKEQLIVQLLLSLPQLSPSQPVPIPPPLPESPSLPILPTCQVLSKQELQTKQKNFKKSTEEQPMKRSEQDQKTVGKPLVSLPRRFITKWKIVGDYLIQLKLFHITFIVVLIFCGYLLYSYLIRFSNTKNHYNIVPVTGTVMLDGQFVDNAAIFLTSISGNELNASGRTNTKGQFICTTENGLFGNGVVPGEYNVIIFKIKDRTSGLDIYEALGDTLSIAKLSKKNGKSNQAIIYIIPEKYCNPATSGIPPIKIEKEKPNHFDFKLSTK
ncbi:MAG: DUF4339 domain-containing protein [Planctomycetaceae bacterium]|jgi:hypothetical protein|nr:DUF4339 domain-containing protein [Planctomycetaceae bacterium]